MSDEQTPLLRIEQERKSRRCNSNEEDGSTVSDEGSLPNYGSTEYPPAALPHNERIIYSWSSMNVFATERSRSKYKFFSLCSRKDNSLLPRKHILKNVHGIAYPGELLAILGSSGAGKTTLLNALTFRSPSNVAVTGLRCVNGIPVSFGALTSQSAYVQQDDLFIGSLTVKEHLTFQALVRMDRSIPRQQRMKRVEEVIKDLALTKCQNTCIGIPGRIKCISGGEMKRLSFAAEVLTNPSMMFCDEPTSGLDSFMALNVIQVLKGMAQNGKTVVCTIHQPSSELYAMFDKLLLMAEGRVAFIGTPDEADIFFRLLDAPCPHNYNPADYFVQLLAVVPGREESCKQAISMICDKFEKSELGLKNFQAATAVQKPDYSYELWSNNDQHKSPYKASWFAQFRAVLWRSWLSVMKDPLLIKVRLLQTVLVSIMIGVIFYGQILNKVGVMNIDGVLFIFLTSMSFQNVFAVINVFCSELPIFLREHQNGMYRTDVYMQNSFGDSIVYLVSIMIGVIFYGQILNKVGVMNIDGVLFIFLTSMSFQNVFAVINVFCSELPIFLREHQNGMYRTDVYFICKTLSETPLFTFVPVIFTCICYFLIGLNPDVTRFFIACGIVTLVAHVAISFGYFISCASSNTSMALSIGPPLMLPFLLFGGFFLNISSIPVYFKWLSYFSWFRFGNEALMINQWRGVGAINCTNTSGICPKNGHVVLEMYNFSEGNFIKDIVMLFAIMFVFRLLAYLALLFKTFRTK
ncbi:ABC transporter [Popillia japonica]|uniref:Protein white n=1 Tax=Popillia japonica TaxID=7064 RepID=A0AAW1LKH1_POPJA